MANLVQAIDPYHDGDARILLALRAAPLTGEQIEARGLTHARERAQAAGYVRRVERDCENGGLYALTPAGREAMPTWRELCSKEAAEARVAAMEATSAARKNSTVEQRARWRAASVKRKRGARK